jgi:hypothetical protein
VTTGAGDAAGDVHLPASHTRSPLQSVSFVHCARAEALANSSVVPLKTAQTARPRISGKLAAYVALSKEVAKTTD